MKYLQIFVHKQTTLPIKQGHHPKTYQSKKSSHKTKIHISNDQGQK